MNKLFFKKSLRISISLLGLLLLSSCAAFLNSNDTKVKLSESYLKTTNKIQQSDDTADLQNGELASGEQSGKMSIIPSLDFADQLRGQTQDLARKFSDKKDVQLAADGLPLKEFLHYAMGEVLQVSYILDEQTKKDSQPVTLNIQDKISSRRLFILLEEVLQQRGYILSYKNDIYYIVTSQKKRGKGNNVFGIGANVADVPNTSRNIVQIVPLKFGLKSSLNQLLSQVVDVIATPDIEQSALFLRGKQDNIIRALEFIALLDRPAQSAQHIGVISLVFTTPDEFISQAMTLMQNEGIPASKEMANGSAIVFVPLVNIGSVAIFARSEDFLRRVEFWGNLIDKPLKGKAKRYFVYHPRFARAVDLGESLSPLLGNSITIASQKNNSSRNTNASSSRRGNDSPVMNRSGQGSSNISLVVDERSNVLVFHSSGAEYQNILPLVKRLDVMPKQILLDVMIAEVTLKDEFKKGVEFVINEATSSGMSTVSTVDAFGVGSGLTYSWVGSDKSINVSLFQDNSLVNVLSQPTILVRDGVEASIAVGTDIPVVGATAIDTTGLREVTTVDYRKTGVELSVTPTVNAQGVLIMNIDLKISNTIDSGVTTAGSPSIFERSIKTEVVAGSGQSIILGGLISENTTEGVTKVPILGDLPILGHLFRGDISSTDKTELVVMVTPKVIHRQDEWAQLKQAFDNKLRNLSLDNEK